MTFRFYHCNINVRELERAYRKHTRAVNGVMALALVWCAAELVIELINGLTQA